VFEQQEDSTHFFFFSIASQYGQQIVSESAKIEFFFQVLVW
jgi:hypothetical protein